MYSKAVINDATSKLSEVLAKNLDALIAVRVNDEKKVIESGDADVMASFLSSVNSVAEGSTMVLADISKGIIPEFLISQTIYETSIQVTVKTRLKAEYPRKWKRSFDFKENVFEDICSFVMLCIIDIFKVVVASENLNALNDKVASAVSDAGIGYSIKFVLLDSKDIVPEITDNSISLNADIDSLLDLSKQNIFGVDGSEYSMFVADKEYKNLVDMLKATPSTVMFLKSKIAFVQYVLGLKVRKRADKLIRLSYHRKAENLGAVKAGVGYFYGTTKVAGEDADIFALVEKSEDGKLEVVLSPFDIKTLTSVKFDVLKALK